MDKFYHEKPARPRYSALGGCPNLRVNSKPCQRGWSRCLVGIAPSRQLRGTPQQPWNCSSTGFV